MPTTSAAVPDTLCLVDVIDFKWLMVGDGHRVHVERLQTDRVYASQCLALGAASRTPALRDATQRLATALNLPPPPTALHAAD